MCGRGGAAIAGKFAIIVRQLQGNKNCKEFTGKYTIQGMQNEKCETIKLVEIVGGDSKKVR